MFKPLSIVRIGIEDEGVTEIFHMKKMRAADAIKLRESKDFQRTTVEKSLCNEDGTPLAKETLREICEDIPISAYNKIFEECLKFQNGKTEKN